MDKVNATIGMQNEIRRKKKENGIQSTRKLAGNKMGFRQKRQKRM